MGALFHATGERSGMKKSYQMKEDGRNMNGGLPPIRLSAVQMQFDFGDI